MDKNFIKLNIDHNKIKDYNDYKEIWNNLPEIEIEMIEKHEECKHNIGDKFVYKNPYKKPENVCTALLHVIDLYIWRITLGFPSWNSENRQIYKIHCPDPKGTVWTLKQVNR